MQSGWRPNELKTRNALKRGSGFSLIETMIAIAIVAISVMLAIPSFGSWLRNSQIRTAAESMQNGIRYAQSEAVRRNTPVRFQLVTSTDNSCALSTTGPSWIVTLGSSKSPAGSCGAGTVVDTAPITDAASTLYVLSKSPVISTSSTAAMTVSTGGSAIAFDGLGRQMVTTNPSTTIGVFTVQITATGAACQTTAKESDRARCLNVVVNPAGQIRVCDRAMTGTNVSC